MSKNSSLRTVVDRDENLHSMRAELQTVVSDLNKLLDTDTTSLTETRKEVSEWDTRWDKCRLYLEQDDLSVSAMETVADLQIIALRNLEAAREIESDIAKRINTIREQIFEAEASIKKLNSMEAHQMLLSAHRMDSPGAYQDVEEFRAIRQKIATVKGFISLREK